MPESDCRYHGPFAGPDCPGITRRNTPCLTRAPAPTEKTSWLDTAQSGDKLTLDGLLRASTHKMRHSESAEEVLRWAAIHIRSLRLEAKRATR